MEPCPGLITLTAKYPLRCCYISPFQICSISENQICISVKSAFSDFQNFFQSDSYWIWMYKQLDLFYHHMAPIELVANLTTRWRLLPFASRRFCNHMIIHCLQFWPPGGATCTDCKFGHQKEPLASVANWATIICIGSKFGHEVSPLALVPKLATRLPHMHCHIAFNCPFGIISWYWLGIFISQSHIS